MNETKFTITIETEKQLTNKEIAEALSDMKWRIMGYTTEFYPDSLKGLKMSIGYNNEHTLLSFKG
jgi:hypothetical protein